MGDFVHSISFQVFLGTVPIASLLYLLNLSTNKRIDSLESSLNKRIDDINKRMDDIMEYMRQSFSAVNTRINELSDRIKRIEDKVFK